MTANLLHKQFENHTFMNFGQHIDDFIFYNYSSSIQFENKKWVGIDIDYWKTDSNFETKNLLNPNTNMKTSVKNIMDLVDLNLAMKCDVQFDEKNRK